MNLTLMRIAEIAVYELFTILPCIILALVPFRDFLRISKRTLGFLILALYILIVILQAIALNRLPITTALSILFIALYLGLYKVVIRTQTSLQFFVLLTILNYESFVAIIYSHFFYHCLKPGNAFFSLHALGILILIYLISYPFMFIIFDRKFRPLVILSEASTIWRYLWLIPAASCLSYYFNLFSNGGVIAFSESSKNVIFAVLLNIGNLLITFMIARLVRESYKTMQLEAENYQLNMQFVQYESLKNRLDEARRARHDFRHNILAIQSYLNDKDYEGLQDYISEYVANLPADKAIVYCENYAVNALLIYYADLAAKQNIAFQAEADYAEINAIAATDAVTLLGNLLENAIEACARQASDKAFITFSLKQIDDMIIVTLDNSYNGMVRKSGSHFISSKNQRIGVGTTSVEKIAAKYHGLTRFEYDDNVFHSSVLLYVTM